MAITRVGTIKLDNQPVDFQLDNKKVSLLGFGAAGWNDQKKDLTNNGMEVFTTSNSDNMLPGDRSIYQKMHGTDILQQKSGNKKIDPASVSAALQSLRNKLADLQDPKTIDALVEFVIKDLLKNHIEKTGLIVDDQLIQDVKNMIHTSPKPSEAMLDYLIELNNDLIPDPDDGKNDMNGYSLVVQMRHSSNIAKFEKCFNGEDKKKLKEILEWMGYVDLTTSSLVTQRILAQSKQLVVDTLQYNLLALKENRPLIPLYFVVSSEAHPPFIPSWSRITQKVGSAYTNAEIRMCYKLMQEMPDPLIQELMKKTVFFYKKLATGKFQAIPFPWEIYEKEWKERSRTNLKPEYTARSEGTIQPWLKELINLSRETLKKVQDSTLREGYTK